jgi:hypothetical protein
MGFFGGVKWFQHQLPIRDLTTFGYRPNVKVEYLNFHFQFKLLIWDPMYKFGKIC